MTEQDERMARYLLGDLPESEAAVVEQEYFADPEKFDAVWEVENDLVDRYVRGELSRGEQRLFERNYLQSSKHRERVAVARRLLDAADRQVREQDESPQPVRSAPSSRSALSGFLNWASTIRLGALRIGLAAVATLLLIGGGLWLMMEQRRLSLELEQAKLHLSEQQRRAKEATEQLTAERAQNESLQTELGQLQDALARQSSAPPDRPSIFSFLLSPMLTPRSGGEPQQQIVIPRETDQINLRIKVDTGGSQRYQASIRTVEGAQLWIQRSLIPRAGLISVIVPASKLPLGDYILRLSTQTATGETEEVNRYFFRVVRK